jgi:hypothetical protein
MIVEVMGRYAGRLALDAGLAGGADVILIPEISYDLEAVCQKFRQRREVGCGAASARDLSGHLVAWPAIMQNDLFDTKFA